ncbi:phosphoglucosamine mutase [Reyranella sp. CPCC 100927]|uniref:phosphoglucosamine mutase n=1 Tax=Reyranella sp. CPCC 100927 TaxID=2599616 RepID=UPI0011B7AC09|nr:phosphoglucosamine mutase [Reyranella sp. CPCC 100927]TWT12707.1 phosphoglucosamine mutase [Reyranella sp. CPCC 100927]
MKRQLFGTDGVRGRANVEPMTADTALRLGMAAGARFVRGDHRHRVVIGKDTRLSGYMLEQALTAGFLSIGMDVLLLGPVPTPAVGYLTRSMRADIGVMISASHNPFQDNGVKFFGPDGFKLSDRIEAEIEALMADDLGNRRAESRALGRARRIEDAGGRYIEAVKASLSRGLTLEDLTVAIDCANGAAYKVAPRVLMELGAKVIPLGIDPDGFNINHDCGSTHPGVLAETVRERGADVGIALDGDADRLVLVSERGEIIDGDQIMATIADVWSHDGRLKGGGVVATLMSNLGLERHLQSRGLTLERTAVGDRYVLERMREAGFNLGGEQSGHLIMTDVATTGDGLLAALQVLAAVKQDRRPVSEVCQRFRPVPQLLRNVRLAPGVNAGLVLDTASIKNALGLAEARLAGGRIVVRKSGTEPLIRVMAEGDDARLVENVVTELCTAIGQAAPQAAE